MYLVRKKRTPYKSLSFEMTFLRSVISFNIVNLERILSFKGKQKQLLDMVWFKIGYQFLGGI